jgi:hypothetical protein
MAVRFLQGIFQNTVFAKNAQAIVALKAFLT